MDANNRTEDEIGEISRLIQSNENFFDLEYRENNCNCISIVLNVETMKIDMLKYISSITRTAKNVNACLPDWIVRLYFDVSVYDHINNNKLDGVLLQNWEYLLDTCNVEIYTFICDDSSYPTARKRSYRFAVLYDREVNVGILREADGIVTVQDCHNIKVFANSNKLLYVVPYDDVMKCTTFLPDAEHCNKEKKAEIFSYSEWLALYKDYMDKDYFDKHWNYYELLAGVFGLKLKLLEQTYMTHVRILKNIIHNVQTQYKTTQPKEFLSGLRSLHISRKNNVDFFGDVIKDITPFLESKPSMGFDEMLLLHIFRDFIFPSGSHTHQSTVYYMKII